MCIVQGTSAAWTRSRVPLTNVLQLGEAKTSTSDSTNSSESEPDSPATNVFATTSQSYCVAFADEYTEDTDDHQTEQKS